MVASKLTDIKLVNYDIFLDEILSKLLYGRIFVPWSDDKSHETIILSNTLIQLLNPLYSMIFKFRLKSSFENQRKPPLFRITIISFWHYETCRVMSDWFRGTDFSVCPAPMIDSFSCILFVSESRVLIMQSLRLQTSAILWWQYRDV